jgi:hypothetical protein
MKVTKAKALSIWPYRFGDKVRPINAVPQRAAEHLLRSEIGAPMRSEVLTGKLRSNDRIALGPLLSRRGAHGFCRGHIPTRPHAV